MNVITCPHCKERIIPKANGTCPNCLSTIKIKGKSSSTSATSSKLKDTKTNSDLKANIERKTVWKSINWKNVYADSRFRQGDKWLIGATLLAGLGLFSLVFNQPITLSIFGIPLANNLFIGIATLVGGISLAIYRLKERLTGYRLVIHGKITKKEIKTKDARSQDYVFLINITKEFILSASGKLEPYDNPWELNRRFAVSPLLFSSYKVDDTVTLLLFSNSEFICDLQEYF